MGGSWEYVSEVAGACKHACGRVPSCVALHHVGLHLHFALCLATLLSIPPNASQALRHSSKMQTLQRYSLPEGFVSCCSHTFNVFKLSYVLSKQIIIYFGFSSPPDNLSIQEFQRNESIDVEVRIYIHEQSAVETLANKMLFHTLFIKKIKLLCVIYTSQLIQFLFNAHHHFDHCVKQCRFHFTYTNLLAEDVFCMYVSVPEKSNSGMSRAPFWAPP